VIDIGRGDALLYPGNYEEFLWSRKQQAVPANPPVAAPAPQRVTQPAKTATAGAAVKESPQSYEGRKRQDAEARKAKKVLDARRKRIEELEARIADRERAIRDVEATMSAPGFYDNHETAKPIIAKHQALMWEVGDLMHQWEELQQTDL
jgi:ATP-binding cassette subfamily F protein 3